MLTGLRVLLVPVFLVTLFVDGGTDALLHPMRPEGTDVSPVVVGVLDKVAGLATRARAMRRRR